MKLRDFQLRELIKKIDENLDHFTITELEDAYDIWSWHPGMG